MSTILECKNLSKKYGRKQALDNITLSLESGKIIGLLGAKWQWKDYFIKLINGYLLQQAENFLSMEIPLESNRKKSSPISQSVPT